MRIIRKLLSFILSFALVLVTIPALRQIVHADEIANVTSFTAPSSWNGDSDGFSAADFGADFVNVSETAAKALEGTGQISSSGWAYVVYKVENSKCYFALYQNGVYVEPITPNAYIYDFHDALYQSVSSNASCYYTTGITTTVDSVTLSPSDAQIIDLNDVVSFTATVNPSEATDKTVIWSVGGTDTGAVALYSDSTCQTPIGTGTTSTLTVYAKGVSAGNATVTVTSNADNTKTASCNVIPKVDYDLWVGNTRVNSANASNIDGNNKASYDVTTNTLTLSGANILTGHTVGSGVCGIYYTGTSALNVVLEDGTSSSIGNVSYGFSSESSVNVSGEGALTITTNTVPESAVGFFSKSDIVINNGTLNINVSNDAGFGLFATDDITFNGGTFNSIAGFVGLFVGGNATIDGAIVDTSSTGTSISSGGIVCEGDVIITDGDLTATGPNLAINCNGSVKNAVAGKGWTDAADTTGETVINPSDASDVSTFKKVYFTSTVPYPLWVGTTQVTNKNSSGTGWSYDVTTNTLTLSGVNITTGHTTSAGTHGIYYDGTGALNIVLENGTSNSIGSVKYGVYSYHDLSISGTGTLTSSGENRGIFAGDNLVINNGVINSSSTAGSGIFAGDNITINGGTINATGDYAGIYSYTNKDITITDGDITAIGSTVAIDGKVKNAIAGKGWTDTAGTTGETVIDPVSGSSTSDVSSYKKVHFKALVTYPLWIGGVQVTENHLSDTGWSYAVATNTLTLSGANIQTGYTDTFNDVDGIYYDGTDELEIVLAENTNSTITNVDTGIYAMDTALTISGTGKLTISATCYGLFSDDDLTIDNGVFDVTVSDFDADCVAIGTNCDMIINDGDIYITTEYDGIGSYHNGDVTINGGLIAISANGYYGAGLYANDAIAINGGETTVLAFVEGSYGFYADDITVNGGIANAVATSGDSDSIYCISMTITGGELNAIASNRTITCQVKNEIPGKGWTNIAGTEGETYLAPVSGSDTTDVFDYRFVHFKTAATVTNAPSANDLTYNDNPQALVTAGTASNGTMNYALGTATAATGTYSANIPEMEYAGTYYVWYKAVGNTGYDDSQEGHVEVEIKKATNYVTVSMQNWTYGDTPNTPTSSATFGTPTFTYSDAEDGTYTDTLPTTAGSWWIKASVAESDNYKAASIKAPWTINLRSITITADSITKPYDGEAIVASSSQVTTGSLKQGDTYTATYTGSQTEVGSCPSTVSNVVIKDADQNDVTANYNITTANGTLTVEVAQVTINFDKNASDATVSPTSKVVSVSNATTKFGDLPIPVRNGYTFAGWSLSGANNNFIKKDNYIPLGSTVYNLKAVWYLNEPEPVMVDGNPVTVVVGDSIPGIGNLKLISNESGNTVLIRLANGILVFPSGEELLIYTQKNVITNFDITDVVDIEAADLNNLEAINIILYSIMPTDEQKANIVDYNTDDSLFFEAHLEKSILGGAATIIQPSGSITLSVKIPNNFAVAPSGYIRTFYIAHFNPDGTVKEYLPAKLITTNGEYYLRFTVSSFSPFAVVFKDAPNNVPHGIPDTATTLLGTLPYAIIIAGMSVSAVLLKKKRK